MTSLLPALRPLRPGADEGPVDAAPRGDRLSGPAGRAGAGAPGARRASGAPGDVVGAGGGRELVLPHHRPGRAGGDGAGLHDEAGGAALARRGGVWTCPAFPCRDDGGRGRRGRARRVGPAAGGAGRDSRPGPRLLAALAAGPHSPLRRSARVGAGGYGAGELHVPRRAGDRCRRLGAGAPGRPHGRHRLAVPAGDAGAVHRLPDAAARVRGAVGQRGRRGRGCATTR